MDEITSNKILDFEFIYKKNKTNVLVRFFLFYKEKLLKEVMFFIFYWLKNSPIKFVFSHLS